MTAELDAASAALLRELDVAKSDLRAALLTGHDTRDARARICAAGDAIAERTRELLRQRGEEEAARGKACLAASVEIARTSLGRLRFKLATVAAPSPPKALRGAE